MTNLDINSVVPKSALQAVKLNDSLQGAKSSHYCKKGGQTNWDIAHSWFYAGDDQAYSTNNENFYYVGKVIYSYDTHFLIAAKYDGITLFNYNYYSSTTSQHQSKVRQAIPANETVLTFDIYGFEILPVVVYNGKVKNKATLRAHRSNIELVVKHIIGLADKASRARKRKEEYLDECLEYITKINIYCKAFGISHLKKDLPVFECTDTSEIANLLSIAYEKDLQATKKRKAREARERKLKEAQDLIDAQDSIKEWKYLYTGQVSYRISENFLRPVTVPLSKCTSEEQYTRLNYIESSKGSRLPLKECKMIWKIANRANTNSQGVRFGNDDKFKFGYYNLIEVTSKGDIQIGCHFLKFSELEEVAKRMGWV